MKSLLFLLSKIKTVLWPVQSNELKKILPMLLIYTLIVFAYSLLRTLKETLIITAPGSGAMALPFLKIWLILPMAFGLTYLFTKLSNKFNREQVFYIMVSIFVVFFLVFGFILYPLHHFLHPHQTAAYLHTILPEGFAGLIAIFKHWTFSLFYVMSELWGALVMSVLFWGFANEVTSVKEAKRFYGIFGIGANVATIMAGSLPFFWENNFIFRYLLRHTKDTWGTKIMFCSLLVATIGLVVMGIYHWLTHHVFRKEIVESRPFDAEKPKVKEKMSMRKNFAYLAKSKYLLCIALIVVSYNIALNMVEVVWKDQMHNLFPNPNDFSEYYSKVMIYIGVVSSVFSIFFCGQIIRRFGWSAGAYFTPVILLITGILFFLFLFFKETNSVVMIAQFLQTTPLMIAVFWGTLQNTFSRASKFTFFDVTKEMTFIPLDPESKLKGKAAIDGIGSRVGKTGGSVIHNIFLFIFSTVSASTPYIAVALFLVIFVWIFAVRSLDKQFKVLSGPDDENSDDSTTGKASMMKEKPSPA